MNVGDLVMFIDTGRYQKWFFGRIGKVISAKTEGPKILRGVQVRWSVPIKYFDRYTTHSHFKSSYFEIIRQYDKSRSNRKNE